MRKSLYTDTETTVASYSTTLAGCGYTYNPATGKLTDDTDGAEVTVNANGTKFQRLVFDNW